MSKCQDAAHLAEDDALPVREYLERDEEGERLVVLCAPCAEELIECGAELVPMREVAPVARRWQRVGGRIAICGGPRSGKSVLATRLEIAGIEVQRCDFLRDTHAWSEASTEIARWMESVGPWVIEGVACVRAVRKRLAADPGRPCDLVVWANTAVVPRSPGQEAMAKGAATIFAGIRPELVRRGVEILEVQ